MRYRYSFSDFNFYYLLFSRSHGRAISIDHFKTVFFKETCIHWVGNVLLAHLSRTAKDFLKWQNEDWLWFAINLSHTITIYESLEDSTIHSVIQAQVSFDAYKWLTVLTFNKKNISSVAQNGSTHWYHLHDKWQSGMVGFCPLCISLLAQYKRSHCESGWILQIFHQ